MVASPCGSDSADRVSLSDFQLLCDIKISHGINSVIQGFKILNDPQGISVGEVLNCT